MPTLRTPILAAISSILAVAANAARAQDDGKAWIGMVSREGAKPPRLECGLDDGRTETLVPDADAMVLKHLATRPWGVNPMLAVSVDGTNRTLIRFPITRGPAVRQATLVLALDGSPMLPRAPMAVSLHEPSAEWNEREVTWERQPACAEAAVAKGSVDAAAKEARIDVTAAVNRLRKEGAANRGWMLRCATPYVDFDAAILETYPWAPSIPEALATAEREHRRVLALVRPGFQESDSCFSEQSLIVCALSDPSVRELIAARFVPVRVCCSPHAHLFPGSAGDPLAPLGTKIAATKPLALVVANGEGRHVATLANIGTYAPDLVLAFLRGALAKAGPVPAEKDPWKLLARGEAEAAKRAFDGMKGPAGRLGLAAVAAFGGDHAGALKALEPITGADEPSRSEAAIRRGLSLLRLGRFDEARRALESVEPADGAALAGARDYALGCLLDRAAERDAARACWSRITARGRDDPWFLKALARLRWPDRMAMEEPLAAVTLPSGADSTETRRTGEAAKGLVAGAIGFLLDRQRSDGSWPNAQIADYDGAVTALVLRSLLLRERHADRNTQLRVAAARDKALGWLRRYVATANAEEANSFSTAYVLDVLVDLAPREKELAQKAVALLLGGQCPHGGWSYSRRFAVAWKGGFGGWPKTDKGREHSMNTGLSLLALARAKAAGLEVDGEALKRGCDAMLAMRREAAAITYTYPDPICFSAPKENLGRAPLCEHALRLLGKADAGDVETALANFMEDRAELRKPVKLTASWVPPAAASSYFYMFAYYHAARALVSHKSDASRARLRQLGDDLLQVVEADGTWVDYPEIGKVYATAMALMVLSFADGSPDSLRAN